MDNAQIGKSIKRYLKHDLRLRRMTLSFNEEELKLLREAARKLRTPVATITRAAALVGVAALLHGDE